MSPSESDRRAAAAEEYLKTISVKVNAELDRNLPPTTDRPSRLHEAMRYSVFAGGKRLRPGLCYAAWKALGGKGDEIFLATSALEMFHTFSLIHDDLPCVDDDDLRRGRPTAHCQYDEATAVMAGDALCVLAFELLSRTGVPEVVGTMARALGTYGMIGGEITDIESEGKKVDLDTVDYIHDCKTACLIEASLVIGAQIAGASQSDIDALARYGRRIGLAFQVVDDVLDVVSTTEQLGKDAGSDIELGKATYPALIGVEASRKRANELVEQALEALESVRADMTVLRDIAEFIVKRAN